MIILTSAAVESKLKSGHFVVAENGKGTAPCWKMFGFPAHLPTDELPQQKPKILNDFVVCKFCLKVFRNHGTKNLNEHLPACPKQKAVRPLPYFMCYKVESGLFGAFSISYSSTHIPI